MPNEGDRAPDVMLAMADGGQVRLAELRGRVVVLYFYPKDDTPGCTTEAIDFTARLPDFEAANAVVIGVSKDASAKHRKFIAKHGIGFGLASDEDGSVCAAFGTWIEKSLYGRHYMGIDRATFLIAADGTIARIWRKVKVKGHADAVLDATRALTA